MAFFDMSGYTCAHQLRAPSDDATSLHAGGATPSRVCRVVVP
jgi:hypothetical protein